MPHITFIHGIANKPPVDLLLEKWISAVEAGGFSLVTANVTASMVYWADVMYAQPKHSASGHESNERESGTEQEDDDLSWALELPDDQARVVAALRRKLGADSKSPTGQDDFVSTANTIIETQSPNGFEAIPLPWFIKRRLMKVFIKDTHHYLFNTNHSPRPNEVFRVRDHIRGLFVNQIIEDATSNMTGKHVVVAHSMGTVIAYDCLKNVASCPSIDSFFTIGSPLGISEIHDNYDPPYSKDSAWPDATLRGEWSNYFDRLDPVALDARLANDYLSNGQERLVDTQVQNSGAWKHSATKYLAQPEFCQTLKNSLEV